MQKEVVLNNLQQIRKGHTLRQEDLAEKVGVTRQTIIAIEKGNYTPSVLLALKIAQVFGKSVEDIFFIKK